METENWYTLAQASLKLGKNRRYLSNLHNVRPEYYEGIELKSFGTSYIIRESDVEVVLSRIKKRGDRLKTSVLERSTKQKMPFCFYPLPILPVSC